jgi:hypothetical protein
MQRGALKYHLAETARIVWGGINRRFHCAPLGVGASGVGEPWPSCTPSAGWRIFGVASVRTPHRVLCVSVHGPPPPAPSRVSALCFHCPKSLPALACGESADPRGSRAPRLSHTIAGSQSCQKRPDLVARASPLQRRYFRNRNRNRNYNYNHNHRHAYTQHVREEKMSV